MKNIMFVIGSLSNGGAERVVSILAEQFMKKGFNVSIITLYDQKNSYLENNSSIKIFSVEHKYKNRFMRAIENILNLSRLIELEKPTIVISFVWQVNIYSIIASLFKNVKLIISERNDPTRDPKKYLLRKMRDLLYQLSNGYVFQTEDAKNYFPTKIKNKGKVIPNPIKENLPYWIKDNNSKVIITACRLTEQKNIPLLIDAFEIFIKDFPNYKLKIFGEGNLRQQLENYIDEKGLNNKVLLPGFTENIHEEMVNSEMFVISSNYEGISNAMLEALAIGIPVISTDSPIGGAKMFIKNNINGILVEVGNVEQLANSMMKIASNRDFANKLSNESIKIREVLSPEKITFEWIQYLNYIDGENNDKK